MGLVSIALGCRKKQIQSKNRLTETIKCKLSHVYNDVVTQIFTLLIELWGMVKRSWPLQMKTLLCTFLYSFSELPCFHKNFWNHSRSPWDFQIFIKWIFADENTLISLSIHASAMQRANTLMKVLGFQVSETFYVEHYFSNRFDRSV